MHDNIIFNISGGLGKNIAATAVVHALKIIHPDSKLIITSPHADAWLNNPDIHTVINREKNPYMYKDYIMGGKSIAHFLEPYSAEDFFHQKKQLIEIWCDLCKVYSPEPRPVLQLTGQEIASVKRKLGITENKHQPIFLIQTNGGAAQQPYPISWARDLPLHIAEKVCIIMRSKGYRPIHIRRKNQPGLRNADWVDFTMREAFAAIGISDKRLFIDSFAQHAAAALNLKCVVVWIANSPAVFGYKDHINLTPQILPVFRHYPNSYLDKFDITGALDQDPYDSSNLFSEDKIIAALDAL